MKAYKFEFRGLALGGEMVVVAATEELARNTAVEEIIKGAYHPRALEGLEMTGTVDMPRGKPVIVHAWNGDY